MLTDIQRTQKLKRQYGAEQVLVVPRRHFKIPDRFHVNKTPPVLSASRFIYRYEAEYSPLFLQPITFVLILNLEGNKIYTTRRLAGDDRLTNILSIGCGGHISPEDNLHKDVFIAAAKRELSEELVLTEEPSLRYLGTVTDYSSPTREHFGIVYVTNLSEVEVRETKKLSGFWATKDILLASFKEFGTWEQYIIQYIFSLNLGEKIL